MTKKGGWFADLLGYRANYYEAHNDKHTCIVIWGRGRIFPNKTWNWTLKKCVGQELIPK